MREVRVEELDATSPLPFVRYAVGPSTDRSARVHGAAVVVDSGPRTLGPAPAADLGPLLPRWSASSRRGGFARPGASGIEVWLGARVEGRLVGVGAVRRDPDDSGHLRGVSGVPEATGRHARRPRRRRAGAADRRLGSAAEHTCSSGQVSSPS